MRTVVSDKTSRERFIEYIRNIDIQKPYTAIFEPVKKKRTVRQNRLMHMWFKLLEDETGTSAKVWKDYYKRKFLTVYRDDCYGKEVETVQGTSELTTAELTSFLDNVRLDASEQGYYLPLPGDQCYDEFDLKYR
jgi:hypothetical protein